MDVVEVEDMGLEQGTGELLVKDMTGLAVSLPQIFQVCGSGRNRFR